MIFSQDREQLRRFYCETWRKHREGELLEPLEAQVRDVILLHPEYQTLLENSERALGRDYLPEFGESNPFLHMGLHLAIYEQLATDRPPGIRALVMEARSGWTDMHGLEHAMMECLADALWHSQREGAAPDEATFFDCLRQRLLHRKA